MPTRREFIKLGARAGAAAVGAGTPFLGEMITPASSGSSRKLIDFGAAVYPDRLIDPDYAKAIKTYCQQIVPEVGLKWKGMRPARASTDNCSPDAFDFRRFDKVYNFAKENGLKVRGHPLIWGHVDKLPAWAKRIPSGKEVRLEFDRHIDCVLERYPLLVSLDVVNEPIDVSNKGVKGLRNSVWLERLGERYIDHAFARARAGNCKAQRVLNEYNIESSSKKRNELLKLVKRLRDREVPINAVGLQCHLSGRVPIHTGGLRDFVQELCEMEVDVLITELDVKDYELPADIAERDRLVAAKVEELLKAVNVPNAISAVLTWGITDKHTSLSQSKFTRADGLPLRPLPLDHSYKPKEMMKVIQQFRRGEL